ncbi:MAG: alanyl-tRNA editing protein [Candidatus Thermoplasmatota archaeon]|jgi:Ser-tRNA(Ala) deacylase AlaX|nr:alanyl-tRNA editing protein [Candidatus Thermoplasmatota archaeon]
MKGALYLTDAYRKEFDSSVSSHVPGGVILEETGFYPTGGGQPSDRGQLVSAEGRPWPVASVEKSEQGIVHRIEGELPPVGTKVHGVLDWDLRYSHMRYHTCLHILSGVVFHRFGSVITGNQIYPDKARMDLSLPEFTPQVADEIIAEVNRVVERNLPVEVRSISRAAADQDPNLVRVSRNLMPDVSEVRLIDIVGFDVQADGGTHVRSTSEVGQVRLLKTENKGSKNKRLYVVAEPPALGGSPP